MLEDRQQFLSIGSFNIPIIESTHAVSREEINRTWRERLFSRPWRPWMKTKIVTKPAMYIVNNSALAAWRFSNAGLREYIVAHPKMAAQIRNLAVKVNSVLNRKGKDAEQEVL